jgi:predicted ATPase
MASSGYLAAASYFTTAIRLQDSDTCWTEHLYKTSLDIFSSAAECAYCMGRFEQMQQYADEIILREGVPLHDKLRPYLTILSSLNARCKYEEIFLLAIGLINDLEIKKLPYSISAFGAAVEYIKTARLTNSFSSQELDNLPLLENSVHVYATGLMDLMCTGLYLTNPTYLSFLTFRHVQECLNQGVGDFSPSAFAFYGLFLCGKRFDLRKGHEQGKLALKTLDRAGSKKTAARVIFLVHGFIYHWTYPVYSMLKPSLEGHRIGLENGDIENAMFNLQNYCIFALHSAVELNSLEREMRKFVETMEDYKQFGVRNITALFWQQTLNLIGHPSTPNHLILTGDAMNEAELMQICQEARNSAILSQIYDLKMQLAYLFASYDLLPDLLRRSGGLEGHMVASAMQPRHVFYRGMAYYALARHHIKSRRLRSKWMKRGHSIAKRVSRLSRAGNINCIHMVDLLAAERMALTGRIREAKRLYGVAIALSSRNGFLQDRALAHERAAIACLDHKDLYWASHHFELAHECYESWGAQAKANHLRNKYMDYCDHGIFSSSVLESTQS